MKCVILVNKKKILYLRRLLVIYNIFNNSISISLNDIILNIIIKYNYKYLNTFIKNLKNEIEKKF